MHIRLPVTPHISITEFMPKDEARIISYLADREIHDRTIGIPFPYGREEFDQLMSVSIETAMEHRGWSIHFAIRDENDSLIGEVVVFNLVECHKAEVGYWLGKPFWGQGIMTAVVGVICKFAIDEWNLVKVAAAIFDGNVASQRVLEKCGFEFEGTMKRHFFKDGQYVDSRHYALFDDLSELPF